MQSQRSGRIPLPLLAALLFALIAAFHVVNAARGSSISRALHLGTALEYARGSIDLFHPVVVGFNATGTPTAQEFPLWQAASGLLFKLTHSEWFGWANLVSLFFFATSLWPFFLLARQYLGERAAWWALVFYLAEPLIIVYSGMASTDGFSLALSLWFLFYADRFIQTGRFKWWLPATVFGVLTAISKMPFFVTAGLCSALILLCYRPNAIRCWILLLATGVISGAVFFAWTHHADSLSAQAVYPYQELRLSENPNMVFWYFGDMHSRLSPGPWLKGGWRFAHATLGSLPFVALLIIALLRPGNRMPKLWLISAIPAVLIFSHLILEHWHYFLMCCPAVALLCGTVLARWENSWEEAARPWLGLALAGIVLVFSAVDGLIVMKISIQLDPFKRNLAGVLRENTKPSDKLVVFDPDDWGGEILICSDRKGLCVYSLENLPGVHTAKGLTELLNTNADLQRLKSLGYNKLVLLSESPVRYAVEAANPKSKKTRRLFPESISPGVDAWPIVYSSPDILIKEIP